MSVYSPQPIEERVAQFWERTRTPKKIATFPAKPKKKFYLLDGPPYANGLAHAGHALTITFKDVWGKFKTMRGYSVWWQPGFDCHGLPIENKVEKEVGIKSKADILAYGTDKFMKKCRDFATTNLTEWMALYRKMASWKGWLDPYFTYDNTYIESGWWAFARIHDKGLVYRGTKPIHWCPHCGTALSGYEVTDSYAEVEDPAVYIKFKLADEDAYVLVWTTTPWTLPSNVALLVHPDETYVKVRIGSETIVLAKALLQTVMERAGAAYTTVEEFKGKQLEGKRYEPLIDCPLQRELTQNKNAHKIYLSVPMLLSTVASKLAEKKGVEAGKNVGHPVTMDVGTGVVHIAPGHGAEDNKIGEHYQLPSPSPLDDACNYTEGTGFTGFVKDADPKIIEYLERNGKLFHQERVVHSYPLCWRCKTPLIFRLSAQWFLSVDAIKQQMIQANSEVKWLPEFARERMHNQLVEAPDWCISTQRFWGIPLPVWECKECGAYEVIASAKELEKRGKKRFEDLHKNVVDLVSWKCKCGGLMKRVPDILNVWFDSGIGPWASLGYPYKNKDLFENLWPVDLVDESQDQVRGWFYYMLVMGVATFSTKPYRTVCLNGWMLDAQGEKMSKSLGNVVDATEAVERLGADLLRLYFCSASAPWGVYKFSFDEAQKLHAPLNVLLNVKNFVKMYGLELKTKGSVKGEANRWIISRVNRLTDDVTHDLETFNFHHAGRKLADFILNDFSRTYMKLAKGGDPKETGKAVGIVLDTYLRLLAPICPYIAEYVYQELLGEWKESVHTRKWPETDRKKMDDGLEDAFKVLDALAEAALTLRQEAGVGLRYPVRALVVSGPKELTDAVASIRPVVEELLNVQEVRAGKSGVTYEVKLNYSIVGKKYGKDVKRIEMALQKEDAAKVASAITTGKPAKIGQYELLPEELKLGVRATEGRGFVTALGPGTVVLDTSQTPEILEESFIRELSRAVQQRRKEMGLKIGAPATLAVSGNEEALKIIKRWEKGLRTGTGSVSVVYNKPMREARTCEFKDWFVEFEVLETSRVSSAPNKRFGDVV